jgi:pimeloyl-ACP methyl ester carboxylesterase
VPGPSPRLRVPVAHTRGMHLERPDGVELWWAAEGVGPPVVLLPGRGDASDLFPRRFTDPLVAAGMQVLRIDPRDVGLSSAGGDEYTLATMADDAIAVLDAAAGPDVAAHWVGVSMGGMQLVDVATRHRDRVVTLTFVAGMSPDPDAGFGEAFFAETSADPVEALLAVLGDVTDADREWVRAEVERAEARAPARPDASEAHMAASMRFGWPTLDQLADIHAPTIVVHGTEDRTLPIAHAEALGNGIAGAEILVRNGMGHIPRPADWDVIAREVVCQAVSTQ